MAATQSIPSGTTLTAGSLTLSPMLVDDEPIAFNSSAVLGRKTLPAGRVRTVDTVLAMQFLATPDLRDGDVIRTLRYSSSHTVGDGSGDEYRYVAASVAGVDGVFTHTGPGGVGRFIAIDQSVGNVMKGGAVGNGTTDDSARILATMNAMSVLGGGMVLLPKRTYEMGHAQLNLPANITIDGQGSTVLDTRFHFPNDNVQLKNLTFHRTDTADIGGFTPYNGIYKLAADNCHLENLRFTTEVVDPTPHSCWVEGATNCVLRNFYFGPESGSMSVHFSGRNIVLDSFEFDYSQDDDALAIKSFAVGQITENIQITNWIVKGSSSAVAIGSQLADRVSNINISNVTCQNCTGVLYLKAGYSTTDPSQVGGIIENVTLNGFTADHKGTGAEHSTLAEFYFTCRKDSVIRNVSISNGMIKSRYKPAEAFGSKFWRVDIFEETSETALIEGVRFSNVTCVDEYEGSIVGVGKPIEFGVEFTQFGSGGTTTVRDIHWKDVTIAHVANNVLLNIPTWVSDFHIDGLTVINPGTEPLGGNYRTAILTDTLAGLTSLTNLRIERYVDDDRLPTANLSNRGGWAASLVPTPGWLQMQELDLGSNSGPFTKRFRLGKRMHIARYELIASAGIPVNTTDYNRYEFRRDTGPSDDIMAWFETRNNQNPSKEDHNLSVAETPKQNSYGLAHSGDEPFFDRNGEHSWLDRTYDLVVQRTDFGTGQADVNLRLRLYYLEF